VQRTRRNPTFNVCRKLTVFLKRQKSKDRYLL